jgi:hypothetical protein
MDKSGSVVLGLRSKNRKLEKELSKSRELLREIFGVMDSVVHASNVEGAGKIWLPMAMKDIRKFLGEW